jgi:hypothetical protein
MGIDPRVQPGKGVRTRYACRLTEAGEDLRAVLIALMDWGDRKVAGSDGPPMSLGHVGCNAGVHAEPVCAEGHPVEKGETRLVPSPVPASLPELRTAQEDCMLIPLQPPGQVSQSGLRGMRAAFRPNSWRTPPRRRVRAWSGDAVHG